MHRNPSEMEPLLPSGVPDLEDLAREVVSRRRPLVDSTIRWRISPQPPFLLLGISKGDLR